MDINEFYTKVAESLDLVVKDGYLMVKSGDELKQLTSGGIPFVLPTRDNITTMLDTDASGNVVTVKHLFNPLDETVVRGDSATLSKLKTLVGVKLANKIAVMGSLLLTVAATPELQAKTGVLINKFLMRLGEAKNPGVKDVVDAKTIDAWNNLYTASFEPRNASMVKVYVKKGGKIGSVKYNRVTTVKSSIYEELCKLSKNEKLNGVRLRNKDIVVFKILLEYMLEGITEKGTIMYGSNDPTAPGFITLMSAYLTHAIKIQMLVKGVKGVDAEWEDVVRSNIAITLDDLKDVSVYDGEVAKIPRENDVARGKLSGNLGEGSRPVLQEVTDTAPPEPVQQPQPAQQQGSNTTSAIKRALYGNVAGINTPAVQRIQPRQPAYPQQQPVQQQMYPQQPVQQPVYPQQPQQPVYPQTPVQQPMYPQQQQPIYPQQQPMYPPQAQPNVSIGAGLDVSASGAAMNTGMQQPMANPWAR